MITTLLPVLLCLLAFVVLPFGSSWYEVPKVVVAAASLLILSGVFLWHAPVQWWKKLPRARSLCLVGVIVLSIIHLWISDTPTALLGNTFRYQGTLMLWGLLAVYVLSALHSAPKFLPVLAAGSLVLTLIGALFGPSDLAGRAVGTLGEANSLAAFALFLWPLTLEKSHRWSWVVTLAITAAIVFLSGSRSGLVGLVVSGVFLVSHPKLGAVKASVLSSSVLIASLGLVFILPAQTFDSRATIWRTALEAGLERPILGWGFGNTEHGLQAAAHEIGTSLRYQFVDSSHNMILDWWVQGGVTGVLLLSSLFYFSWQGLVNRLSIPMLASWLGVVSVAFFNPLSVAVLVPVFWLLGQGSAQVPPSRSRR